MQARFLGECGPQLGVRRNGWCMPAFDESPDVLSGAAHDDRDGVPRGDISDGGARLGKESREVVALVRRGDVDEVVGHRGDFGGRRFTRADGHAPVHLAAVRVDDLDPRVGRKLERRSGLAARGRPDDEEHARPGHDQAGANALTMAAKSAATRLAPPTSAPSMSGCSASESAFPGLTLPP